MENVGVFGGAFNPITIAHLEIAKKALDFFDSIWLMPCYNHVYNKKTIHHSKRIEMINISIKNLEHKDKGRIFCSYFEIDNKSNGSSNELLNKLIKEYPKINFGFIIGQDNADTIHKWINYKELIEKTSFCVFSRNDKKCLQNWYMKKPHSFIRKDLNISSTMVRNKIEKNKSISGLVLPQIEEYIKKNDLYIHSIS